MNLNLTGNANAILMNLNAAAKSNDPQLKVTPVGFLQMLLEHNAAGLAITNADDLRKGQNATIKVRYQKRGLESEVGTTDECGSTASGGYSETTITHAKFVRMGLKIDDDDMRLMTAAANENGGNGMNRAMVELIYTKVNGLIQKMDSLLVAEMSSAFGKNKAYAGTAAGAVQNIAFGEKMTMNNGLVKLRSDMSTNETYGDLLVCGNGRIVAYDTYQRYKSGTGKDGIGSLPLNVYEDHKTATSWGANYFGVFEQNCVGYVDWLKNVGNYAGDKGNSVFFTLPMPITLSNGQMITITFDAQLRYVDCPTYTDGAKTIDRGYELVLSKSFGLFTIPSDCYASTDPLNGVRGSYLYCATEPTDETIIRPASDAKFNVKTATGDSVATTTTPATGAVFTTQAATETAGGGD